VRWHWGETDNLCRALPGRTSWRQPRVNRGHQSSSQQLGFSPLVSRGHGAVIEPDDVLLVTSKTYRTR
jgi:hypothetical protein